jgi:hypothetical protein
MEGIGDGGVIIHDHHVLPFAGSSLFFPIVTDPERAELLACRRVVKLAKEGGGDETCSENQLCRGSGEAHKQGD